MPNEVPYGIHLDSAGNVPDYELGWLGFSGEKHGQFPESDELVAIIYDPAYMDLSDLEPTDANNSKRRLRAHGRSLPKRNQNPRHRSGSEEGGVL